MKQKKVPKSFSGGFIFSQKKFSVTTQELQFLDLEHYAHNRGWAGFLSFLKSGKVFGKSKMDKNKCPKTEIPKYF